MPRISSTTRHRRIIEDPFWAGPAEDEPTTEERFWWNVDVRDLEECWPWQGTTTTEGYGHFYIGHHGGKRFTMNAHRFSYFLATGPANEDAISTTTARTGPASTPDTSTLLPLDSTPHGIELVVVLTTSGAPSRNPS